MPVYPYDDIKISLLPATPTRVVKTRARSMRTKAFLFLGGRTKIHHEERGATTSFMGDVNRREIVVMDHAGLNPPVIRTIRLQVAPYGVLERGDPLGLVACSCISRESWPQSRTSN